MGRVIKKAISQKLRNVLRLKEKYEAALLKIPRGHLSGKITKGHKYYYLVMREKGEKKFIYKGKLPRAEIKKYDDIKKTRAKYMRLLIPVNRQIKILGRQSRRAK